jgi:hypothetical protein
MIKPNVKLGLVALMLFTAAAIMLWQKQRAEHWMAESASLREALAKAAPFLKENQELREQLHAATQRAAADAQELARLHAVAAAVRQPEQGDARLDSERNTSQQQPRSQPKVESMDRMYGPGTSDRGIHCYRWGYALLSYARHHYGQFPMSLREVVGYLGDDESAFRTALTRDQFEILYRGWLDEMTDPGATPVLREKRPLQTANGIWTRAYAYGNMVAKIETSTDDSLD